MALPPDRLERFARHIVLPELGGAGQVALTESHVAVIGCGGIGSPAIQYLAAAARSFVARTGGVIPFPHAASASTGRRR